MHSYTEGQGPRTLLSAVWVLAASLAQPTRNAER